MALVAEAHAERFDEGAFARAGHAGNADPDRFAGVRDQLAQHLLSHVEMRLGIALHQRNGLAKDVAVARQHAGDVFIHG